MRITFVLPAPIRIPMGGAKVVYEHAKGLAGLGHTVVVVGPERAGGDAKSRLMQSAIWFRDRLHGVSATPYYGAEGVETLTVPEAVSAYIPKADIVVATGVQTAPWVADLHDDRGKKFYFIQGYETFADHGAVDTWRLPMQKFTCANWLRREIEKVGENVLGVVPNAIDPTEFYIEKPVEGRTARIVALYHRHPVKGPDVLIEALHAMKGALPDLQADVFSARPPSHRLPRFVNVHLRPDEAHLRRLYNEAAVLLHPSRSEGFPLVPMEAAACGCAIVGSANEGVQQYLDAGKTMLIAPVGDGAALARAALSLLKNQNQRVQFTRAAEKAVSKYRWVDSTAQLESLLLSSLAA